MLQIQGLFHLTRNRLRGVLSVPYRAQFFHWSSSFNLLLSSKDQESETTQILASYIGPRNTRLPLVRRLLLRLGTHEMHGPLSFCCRIKISLVLVDFATVTN